MHLQKKVETWTVARDANHVKECVCQLSAVKYAAILSSVLRTVLTY